LDNYLKLTLHNHKHKVKMPQLNQLKAMNK